MVVIQSPDHLFIELSIKGNRILVVMLRHDHSDVPCRSGRGPGGGAGDVSHLLRHLFDPDPHLLADPRLSRQCLRHRHIAHSDPCRYICQCNSFSHIDPPSSRNLHPKACRLPDKSTKIFLKIYLTKLYLFNLYLVNSKYTQILRYCQWQLLFTPAEKNSFSFSLISCTIKTAFVLPRI